MRRPLCPIHKKPREGPVTPEKLHKQLASVQREFQELSVANSQLQARERLLVDTCRILALVTTILAEDEKGHSLAQSALVSLEAGLAGLAGSEASLINVPQLEQVPGGTEQFILSSLNKERVLGPSSSSVLHGQPLSLLEFAVLAYGRDPLFRQDFLSGLQLDPEFIGTAYKDIVAQFRVHARALEEAQDAEAKAAATAELACQFLIYLILVAGIYIVAPSVQSFEGIINNDPSRHLGELASAALLEHVTDKLSLKDEQLEEIMFGLEVFSDLQKPLDKQEAELWDQIRELLQLPPKLGQEAIPSATAQLLQSSERPAVAAAAASTKVQSVAASGGRTAAAAAAALPGQEGDTADEISAAAAGFMLTSAKVTDHSELQPLLDQLQKIQYKLMWLDGCAAWFVVGCLTWEQHQKLLLESWPHVGSGVPFAKSLALRSSLRWLLLLEGQ